MWRPLHWTCQLIICHVTLKNWRHKRTTCHMICVMIQCPPAPTGERGSTSLGSRHVPNVQSEHVVDLQVRWGPEEPHFKQILILPLDLDPLFSRGPNPPDIIIWTVIFWSNGYNYYNFWKRFLFVIVGSKFDCLYYWIRRIRTPDQERIQIPYFPPTRSLLCRESD